jgi:hypothetical protein
MKNIYRSACYFYDLGINIFCISNNITYKNYDALNTLKSPCHSWEHMIERRQTKEELDKLPWAQATGLGIILGYNNLMAIDVDGFYDEKLIKLICEFLSLPSDYKWVVLSGSKTGFHIILEVTDKEIINDRNFKEYDYETYSQFSTWPNYQFEFTPFGKGNANAYYPVSSQIRPFNKMEFLWKANLAIPPSQHISTDSYNFINGFPKLKPSTVSIKKLFQLKEKTCSIQSCFASSGENEERYYVHIAPKYWIDYNYEMYSQEPRLVFACHIYKVDSYNELFLIQISWSVLGNGNNIIKRKTFNYFSNKVDWKINDFVSYDCAVKVVNFNRNVLQEFLFDANHVKEIITFNKNSIEFIKLEIEKAGLYSDALDFYNDYKNNEGNQVIDKNIVHLQNDNKSMYVLFLEIYKNSFNNRINSVIKLQILLYLLFTKDGTKFSIPDIKYEHDYIIDFENDKEIRNLGLYDEDSRDYSYNNNSDYSIYGGAYGYDDNTINNAFDGDPENYWNID